jgi:hypothetical protein
MRLRGGEIAGGEVFAGEEMADVAGKFVGGAGLGLEKTCGRTAL